jgi:hypothetical protein
MRNPEPKLVRTRVATNARAIGQILDQAGRRDYTVKVYSNGSHNLMEVPPDNTDEQVRLKGFPPGFFLTMVDWTTTQLRRFAASKRWVALWLKVISVTRHPTPAFLFTLYDSCSPFWPGDLRNDYLATSASADMYRRLGRTAAGRASY